MRCFSFSSLADSIAHSRMRKKYFHESASGERKKKLRQATMMMSNKFVLFILHTRMSQKFHFDLLSRVKNFSCYAVRVFALFFGVSKPFYVLDVFTFFCLLRFARLEGRKELNETSHKFLEVVSLIRRKKSSTRKEQIDTRERGTSEREEDNIPPPTYSHSLWLIPNVPEFPLPEPPLLPWLHRNESFCRLISERFRPNGKNQNTHRNFFPGWNEVRREKCR